MRSTKNCLCSCDMQLREEGTHVVTKGPVMLIDPAAFLRFAASFGAGGSGENRLDNFLAQDQERRHRAQALGKRVIATGVLAFGDEVLPPQFLQVVGGTAGSVRGRHRSRDLLDLRRKLGDGEPVGRGRERERGLKYRAHPWLVD